VGMSRNAMVVMVRLEGFNKYGVAVTVIGQHDVLVATAGAGGESSHVVCVELADGLNGDVQFMGGGRQRRRRSRGRIRPWPCSGGQ
jgi:hypothetical protein